MMKFSDIKLPSNRKFGFFFTVIFTIISIYLFFYDNYNTAYIFLVISVIFFVITILKAELLLPLNKLWMRFGFILGLIINPVVLGIIYFLVFTPTGLIMRLFRRDELRIKLKKRNSYWKLRSKRDVNIDLFKQQF